MFMNLAEAKSNFCWGKDDLLRDRDSIAADVVYVNQVLLPGTRYQEGAFGFIGLLLHSS